MSTDAPQKVTARHLARNAYLYVRQSTVRQVLENTESTQRQYALHCPRCGGPRRIVAVHTRAETVRPLLERLGLAVPAAARRPSRSPPARAG